MLADISVFLENIHFISYVFFFTVIFLIILVISLIYFIKLNAAGEVVENDPDGLRNIASMIKKQPKTVKFTAYEREQEEKAIISYEELLENTGEFKLNYLDEEYNRDVDVKKVNLDNLIDFKIDDEPQKLEIHLISLDKEEEFLKTLKDLKNSLS